MYAIPGQHPKFEHSIHHRKQFRNRRAMSWVKRDNRIQNKTHSDGKGEGDYGGEGVRAIK